MKKLAHTIGEGIGFAMVLAIVVGCGEGTTSSVPAVANRTPPVLEDFLKRWEDDSEATAVAMFVDTVHGAEVNALKLYPISEDDFVDLPETDRDELRRRIMHTGEELFRFAKAASQVAILAREENRCEEADRIAESLFRVARANVEEPTTLLATRYASAVERYGELARCTQVQDEGAGGTVEPE